MPPTTENLTAYPGDKVLLVTTPTADQNQLLTAKNNLVTHVTGSGAVAFEQLERVAVAPLASASYTTIYSNFFHPSVHSHPPTSLQKFLQTLTPGGILTLREPVLLEPLPPATCPVTRSSQELVSALRLTGFIDITIASLDPVAEQDLTDFFHVWGATRVEQGITVLGGKLAVATVVARKPAYEVGQKVALNFARKTNPVVGDGGPAKSTAAAWTLSLNDEDEELEDEDALLDEEDKIKPSKASLTRPDDCELVDGKRKACKNCTCSRASMLEEDDVDLTDGSSASSNEIVEVDPTPKKVGGCGSCALGDAFRCSTCPYLGIPAFNEGEQVVLAGVFGGDDIDI